MRLPRTPLTDALYGAGIRAYAAAVRAAGRRNRKARLMTDGQRRTWRELEKLDPERRVVWLHAASLGEFEQGRPVIERIRTEMPDVQILLTFFSPSGYEVRRNYAGADVVCYLPFDTRANARRLVREARPSMAIFVKYEFWRSYIRALAEADVPTYLISAIFRPGQIFFRPWGRAYRNLLRLYDGIFVQDEGSRSLLAGIGTDSIVAGDTRFDRVAEIASRRRRAKELDAFLTEREMMLVVGSSWPADEDVYIPWLNSRPEAGAIIAPHEFDAARLKDLRRRIKGGAVLLSELGENPERGAHAQAVIIDCFGLLSSLYAYADVAYVGGGFGAGIHNINEAAVYGVPVLFGPNHSKFIEARELIAAGGGFCVNSESDFAERADNLLRDPESREISGHASDAYIRSKLGATDAILTTLLPRLRPALS